MEAKPPAEVIIDSSLVRALLEEQHPDLAHLALTDVGEGWDNRLFRLGHDLAVRAPRRAASAALIEQEQQWLPQLSLQLPVAVPVPVRIGRPGSGFPWPWSVVPWFSGESALMAPPKNLAPMVIGLARFLRALHQPAPDNAPHNPWRGVPLGTRDERLRENLRQLNGLVDSLGVLSLWERVVSVPPWSGPPLWIHGDLHPGNLLVSESTLSAVIDFGDLAAGDPATDLSVMWMLHSAHWSSLAFARRELTFDNDTWMRARGWALALGLTYLANSRDDEAMGALGQTTIDAALSDTLPAQAREKIETHT
jgi:aminoglycoside phosphotransferase (APT) family kinase protein